MATKSKKNYALTFKKKNGGQFTNRYKTKAMADKSSKAWKSKKGKLVGSVRKLK
tara:strand:+ start:5173 stop:5334 length:162 start_codon:yes stop_codon:yes gene_type:complete